jgi:predicted HD superfamily hydrolase involved in NAD metabolism
MRKIFTALLGGLALSGNLPKDVTTFLVQNGYQNTANHSRQVAEAAHKLALRFGADPDKAVSAGWLHDISVIFLDDQRIGIARQLGLSLLPEEETNPVLMHQKISVLMAGEIFGVKDPEILDAIGCHTTLRAHATLLDKVLFVADKIAWDQVGNPAYLEEIIVAANSSLDEAALVYIRYLYRRQSQLAGPLHPWLLAAFQELSNREVV